MNSKKNKIMKTKVSLFLIAMCTVTFNSVAQTNYVTRGDMTGTTLNYVNQASSVLSPTAGANSGWVGVFGGSVPYQALDIVSTTDTDTGSGRGDVIQITANSKNSGVNSAANMSLNARLLQRLASTPISTYRLKFKAKAITSDATTLVVNLRSTNNNVPAYVLDGYDSNSTLATGFTTFTPTQTWADYTVDFDMSRTVSTLAASPTIAATTGSQYPSICFQLQSAATGPGVMIDDVSFELKSVYTAELNLYNKNESSITAVITGLNQVRIENVKGLVSIFNSVGKLIDQKLAVNNLVNFTVKERGVYLISNGKNKLKIII